MFLCLLGTFPPRENGFQLLISLTAEKRAVRPALLSSYIKAGSISHRCLEKLLGRLAFPQTSAFGEFARFQLRPMYQKFYRRVYNARLKPLESENLTWRIGPIADYTPRVARIRSSRADWLVYTDASTGPARLCALLFRGDRVRPSLDTLATAKADAPRCLLFRHRALIFGLDLLALAAFFELKAPLISGSRCWV